MKHCVVCGDEFVEARWVIGYRTCLACGDKDARAVRHTVVPMPKSNYILVTDMALLRGLNSSHKGGLV